MRVIVTGSRNWREPARIWEILDLCADAGDFTLIHGACRKGADWYAHQWYERQRFQPNSLVGEDPFPADWHRYGKQAGFIRNQEMVNAGADLVLAFATRCDDVTCYRHNTVGEHMTHGTEHCVLAAEEAHLTVITFWSEL